MATRNNRGILPLKKPSKTRALLPRIATSISVASSSQSASKSAQVKCPVIDKDTRKAAEKDGLKVTGARVAPLRIARCYAMTHVWQYFALGHTKSPITMFGFGYIRNSLECNRALRYYRRAAQMWES